MRPTNVIDAKIEGNLGGETVKMEIDATATAHLMTVLTDLYADRIMAFVREYSTNAHDAHLEAGVSRPIEVTLPTRLSNYYRIKDYGLGLDIDGIRDIYSKYGASTKRSSNAFNGMLGLGCKSAMTYAAQFSIISVKDGMKYNVAVSRGADGVGEMQVIDTTPTDETNGVEIVIPVKQSDVWAVAEKVQQFFQWWPEGTVLVNGKAPKRFEGREIVKNLYMVDGLEKDLIVMGNVAYPIPFEEGIYVGEKDRFGYNRKNFGVVYFAEMGAVTFAPSRESLTTNKNTKDTVDHARQLFVDNLRKSIQAEFDALETPVAALKHRRELENRYRDLKLGVFTYKGVEIPEKGFEAPFKMVTPQPTAQQVLRGVTPAPQKEYDYFNWYDATGGSPESQRSLLDLETIERYSTSMVFIVNAPKKLTTHQKMKARRSWDAGDLQKSWLFFTPEANKPGGMWTDGIPVQDWSIIRDFKIAGSGTSDSTKHDVWSPDGSQTNRTIPDAEKIVYVSPTFFKSDSYYGPKVSWYRSFVNDSGFSYVLLSKNRHAKFEREHANALTLSVFMRMKVAEYEKSLSEIDKMLLSMEGGDLDRLRAMDGLDIADKTVVALVAKADRDAFNAAKKRRESISTLAGHLSIRLTDIPSREPFSDYPLVSCLSSHEVRSHRAHVTEYINAVFAAKKGN